MEVQIFFSTLLIKEMAGMPFGIANYINGKSFQKH